MFFHPNCPSSTSRKPRNIHILYNQADELRKNKNGNKQRSFPSSNQEKISSIMQWITQLAALWTSWNLETKSRGHLAGSVGHAHNQDLGHLGSRSGSANRLGDPGWAVLTFLSLGSVCHMMPALPSSPRLVQMGHQMSQGFQYAEC